MSSDPVTVENIRKRLVEVRDAYEQLWDAVLEEGIEQGIFATEGRRSRESRRSPCAHRRGLVQAERSSDRRSGGAKLLPLVLRMLARRERADGPADGSTNVR